jgi:ribosomal protein RSM22 (predicted rRNA methylase)
MSAWTTDEIQTLTRLRDGFLSGTAGAADYWRSASDVELYDRTFGRRIGWKWEAVLGELSLRGWTPRSSTLVDWGCGGGIASRTVNEHWRGQFRRINLVDRSPLALDFAASKLRGTVPEVQLGMGDVNRTSEDGALWLFSHVLTELSKEQLDRVRRNTATATGLIWVESATHDNARRLVEEVRDKLLATGDWSVVAPCTHSGACPMLEASRERHWCHHFARVPSEVHQDRGWRELSLRLGMDLRSLPYSFLAMERRNISKQSEGETVFSRVIGKAREFKGHLKVLTCSEDALTEKVLQKRDAPALFKEVRSGEALPLYAWTEKDGRIVGARGWGGATEGEKTAD